MKYTIEDLRNGKCAVINDGTHEELLIVLQMAFPNDKYALSGAYTFYAQQPNRPDFWRGMSSSNLPTQSVKDFLLPKSEYPKLMWVSDYPDFADACKRVVFMEKHGRFISWRSVETLEAAEEIFATSHWKYAKDIEEPQTVELTFKDISEGKGVGVDPSLIRIKE